MSTAAIAPDFVGLNGSKGQFSWWQRTSSVVAPPIQTLDYSSSRAPYPETDINWMRCLFEHTDEQLTCGESLFDAMRFAASIPSDPALHPELFFGADGEIAFQWKFQGKEAIVSLEGDGKFSYALLIDNIFVPGAFEGQIKDERLPSDLIEYLRK